MTHKLSDSNEGNALVYVLLLVILVVVVGMDFWAIRNTKKPSTSTAPSTAQTTTPSTSAGSAKPLASGTDNSSLNSDLGNINTSLTQSGNDSSTATNSVNDQSQLQTVPQS